MNRSRVTIRVAFALINFCVATFFAINSVVGIAAPETPGAFFGSILGLLPFSIYGWSEWCVLYHLQSSKERILGYWNLGAAAFVAFGIVTNVGEVLMDDGPLDVQFLFGFTLIGGSIAAYLAVCGWSRLKWTRSA